MDLELTRTKSGLYGIFGSLSCGIFTLEHAYPVGLSKWGPKVPIGTYICQRGTHQLVGRPPFETFEVTNVPGHIGILFHPGNVNNDSEGCILLGLEVGQNCILESRLAFQKFMDLQAGIDSFTLTVKGENV